jgi:cytoplasmic iron level regulating protein YaaA (DUF328/UPF0246 family)
MLLIISPAKSLNSEKAELEKYTLPVFLKNSKELVGILKKNKVSDLMKLMDISENIAVVNYQRFRDFNTDFNPDNAKQALIHFDGDVYDGIAAGDFTNEDFEFAQNNVRILSGLYGVLKPLDLMQAYRLEMGTALTNKNGKNLYAYWGDKITDELNRCIVSEGHKQVLNLASVEYWSAVKPNKLKAEVIEIQFKENRNGLYKVISFNAKKARGMMCRFVIKEMLRNPEEIKNFKLENYSFNEELSNEKEWIFTR